MGEPGSVEYRTIPIDLIDPPDTPVRSVADEEKLRELAESIRSVGVLEPIRVRPYGSRYKIIYGHMRFLAAQAAGLIEIPAMVGDVSALEELLLMLEENAGRQDVNPLDEARLYDRLIRMYGMDIEEIARKRGCSPATIYTKLSLLKGPPDVQEALQKGHITQSHALAISKLPTEERRAYWIHQARDFGWTAEMVSTNIAKELIASGLRAAPEPVHAPPPVQTIPVGGGGICDMCGAIFPPEQLLGMFMCMEDWRLFQKFKEAYHAEDKERVEAVRAADRS